MSVRTRLARARFPRPLIAAAVALATAGALATALPAQAAPHGSTGAGTPLSAASPNGPVGWDVYRRLDRFDQLTTGVQTKQFSSFDRTNGNGDFNRCLGTTSDDKCLLAQAQGAGEIDSIWSTRDGGDVTKTGNIKVVLDGRTIIDAPFQDVVNGKLGAPFVYPVVANADQSSGGVYIIAPMTYRRSMQVITDVDPNYYHVTYRTFATAQGVKTFDPSDRATDVIAMLKKAGTQDPKPAAPRSTTTNRSFTLAPGKSVSLANTTGSGHVNAVRVQVPNLTAPTPTKNISDDGRAFGAGGYSQFTVKINPDNNGVKLIRRVDSGIGHQVATVSVDGKQVGQWDPMPTGGSCKWVDQTVNLPASATKGKSSITVRNTFVSSDLDFNEFHYWVDSTVGGKDVRTDEVDVGPDHTAAEQAHDYSIQKQTFQGTWQYCYTQTGSTNPKVLATNEILAGVHVRVTVDGVRTVDAPLGQFFGSGRTYSKVRSLFSAMGAGTNGWFSAWWPMAYGRSVQVSLVNGSTHTISSGQSQVTTASDATVATALKQGSIGWFQAQSRAADTVAGQDYPYLDAAGHGKYVGVVVDMAGPGNRSYLEGDERAYVDGRHTAQIHGTGTEDYYEGGWYFNRDTFTNPVNGNPSHSPGTNGCATDGDCTSVYRFMVSDAVPYASSLSFGIEHGPVDDVAAHYSSTAFFYGQSTVAAKRTDAIDVGDTGSEKAHAYSGRNIGARTALTSTYEGNNAAPIPLTDDARSTGSPVSFDVAIDPKNAGVVLDRTSDQNAAEQQSTVQVNGQTVGVWQQPLNNTEHRWLDDEFTLPASATSGRKKITVTLRPAAGTPPWSAAAYAVTSLVAPFADRSAPQQVSGLSATGGDGNTVDLQWTPARDNVATTTYRVYASTTRSVPIDTAHLIGTSTVPGYAASGLALRTTYWYRVVAVDAAGNRSPASGTASATTGDTARIEAETLLPATAGTAPAVSQGNCCGISWSGGAQLWLQPTAAGQYVTLHFDVATAGNYAMSSVQTQAPDYGISTLAVDGTTVGQPLDGYRASGVAVTAPQNDGTVHLSAGTHTLTFTVTGKNAAASGLLAGLDYVDLQLTT